MVHSRNLEDEQREPVDGLDSWMDEEDRFALELEELKSFLGEEPGEQIGISSQEEIRPSDGEAFPEEEKQSPDEASSPEEEKQSSDEAVLAAEEPEIPVEMPILEASPDAPEQKPQKQKKDRSGRASPWLILLVVLELAGIGGIAWWWLAWIR